MLPRDEAIAAIKDSIRKTYGKKGEEIVQMNLAAVDQTLAHLHEVKVPDRIASKIEIPKPVAGDAPQFVRDVLGPMIAGRGDRAAGERSPVRRNIPDRHLAMGKAQLGGRDAGLGSGCLYPVRQVRDGVPARGDSQQGL